MQPYGSQKSSQQQQQPQPAAGYYGQQSHDPQYPSAYGYGQQQPAQPQYPGYYGQQPQQQPGDPALAQYPSQPNPATGTYGQQHAGYGQQQQPPYGAHPHHQQPPPVHQQPAGFAPVVGAVATGLPAGPPVKPLHVDHFSDEGLRKQQGNSGVIVFLVVLLILFPIAAIAQAIYTGNYATALAVIPLIVLIVWFNQLVDSQAYKVEVDVGQNRLWVQRRGPFTFCCPRVTDVPLSNVAKVEVPRQRGDEEGAPSAIMCAVVDQQRIYMGTSSLCGTTADQILDEAKCIAYLARRAGAQLAEPEFEEAGCGCRTV